MSGKIRLNGSTSGFSEITAPAVAGDQTFTLPAAGGEIAVVGSSIPWNRIGTNLSPTDIGDSVGIGTTNPTSNLVVEAATGDATLRIHAAENDSGSEPILTLESSNDFAESVINFNDSSGTAGGVRYNHGDNALRFLGKSVNGEAMRIDSAGRLLIGTTTDSGSQLLQMIGGSSATADVFIGNSVASTGQTAKITMAPANSIAGAQLICTAEEDFASGANRTARLSFATRLNGSLEEWMRIRSDGYINAGGYIGSGYHRFNGINATAGTTVLVVSGYQSSGGSDQDSAIFASTSDPSQPNALDSVLRLYKNSTTSRSINASGTINASGSDYAEYMVKSGNFTIAKGDICGVNSEGKLTNVFADSISFVVKSTDPSYVGGDTWHTSVGEAPGGYSDERTESEIEAAKVVYEQNLETARNNVDRIAFAGQVPVNVQGTNAGQYIVPVETADGGITGEANNESDLTLVEYMRAVGQVIAIEDDGRARIIVKIS